MPVRTASGRPRLAGARKRLACPARAQGRGCPRRSTGVSRTSPALLARSIVAARRVDLGVRQSLDQEVGLSFGPPSHDLAVRISGFLCERGRFGPRAASFLPETSAGPIGDSCDDRADRRKGPRGLRSQFKPTVLVVRLDLVAGWALSRVTVPMIGRPHDLVHGVLTQGAKGSAGKIGSQRTTASASARSNRISSSPQNALGASLGLRSRNRSSQRRASSW